MRHVICLLPLALSPAIGLAQAAVEAPPPDTEAISPPAVQPAQQHPKPETGAPRPQDRARERVTTKERVPAGQAVSFPADI